MKLYIFAIFSSILFTGCLNEMEKIMHPVAKCSNKGVVQDLSIQLNANSMYPTKVEIDRNSIILIGVNEESDSKTCRALVKYSLDTEDNSSVVSVMSMMPMVSDMSSKMHVEYVVSRDLDRKSFKVNIAK